MSKLTYAGIPLLYDFQHAAQEFLDRYQRLEDLIDDPITTSHDSWQTNPARNESGLGRSIGLPRYNWPERPPLKINQLYWPTGASRFSYGLFLIDQDGLDALLKKDCREPNILLSSYDTVAAETKDTAGSTPLTLTFSEMYWLTPQRINDCASDNGLYLLPLVDRRYWWQFKDVGDIKSALQGAVVACEEACTGTWDDLFSYLATVIGETYTAGGIPAAYGKPDCIEFARQYQNVGILLDAALASIGARLVSKLDGSMGFQRPADATTALTANLATVKYQIAGTDCTDMRASYLPQYVRVTFPKSFCYHLTCDDDKYPLTYTNSAYCLQPNCYKTIHSSAVADYQCDCDGDSEAPKNLATIQALTTQIGTDWNDWHYYEYDFTFAIPQAWNPTGYDDHVLWSFGCEVWEEYLPIASQTEDVNGESPNTQVMLQSAFRRDHMTRVQSLPMTCDVDCMLHYLDTTLFGDNVLVELTCWEQDDCCEAGEWPKATGQVMNWCDCDYVELTGYTIPVYSSVGFLCDKLTELKAQMAAAKCIPIKDNCCEYVWARWNCDANRWEVEAKYDDLWRFELNEPLCLGDCADATLWLACCEGELQATDVTFNVCDKSELVCPSTSNSPQSYWVEADDCIALNESQGQATIIEYGEAGWASTGTSVYVDNTNCYVFALPGERFKVDTGSGGAAGTEQCLPAGTKGVARFWPDTCEFEVVSINNCGESPSPGATVVPSHPFGLRRKIKVEATVACAASGTGYVYDCNGSLSECSVTFDNNTNRAFACDVSAEDLYVSAVPGCCTWEAEYKPRPRLAKARLTGNMCTDDDAAITDFTILDTCDTDWTGFTPVGDLDNPFELVGCISSIVQLTWQEGGCKWIVSNVSPRNFQVIKDVEYDSETCSVSKTKYLTAYFYGCGESVCPEIDEQTLFSATQESVVTGIGLAWTDGSDSGTGCPTGSSATVNLTATRKKVWVMCESESDTDATLALSQVEAIVDADLQCDPCIGITPSTQSFYAFCAGTPETLSTEECDCYDCPSDSSSS
jgi:hypothetical protein